MTRIALPVFLLFFSQSAMVRAQEATGRASEARLATLSHAQRTLLEPHLERGPVLLARFYDGDSDMPSISLASYIDAPPSEVAATVRNPRAYGSFMPAIDSVHIESERAEQIAYTWTWRLALFTLRGRNVMTSLGDGGPRGYRIDVRGTDGDLGESRFVWRIHPAGPRRSLVVLSSRTDMRGANYVADQLSRGGRSVQRSINISMATVMLLGTKKETERRIGVAVRPERLLGELERPDLDVERLWPLLEHGDLVFFELEGDSIARISGLARSSRSVDHTRAVMIDPEEFGRSLISGSTAQILERSEDSVLFEWGIPLPLIGVEGRMHLRPGAGAAVPHGVIEVDGARGSLASSRWRFDTHPRGPHETVVIGWSRYDMHETSPVIRRMIGDDVAFSHGLALATQVMILRSLRTRARRHQN